MDNLKYIIDSDKDFVIFSPTINHSDMVMGFGYGSKAISAGFCQLITEEVINRNGMREEEIRVKCFGESISLGIKSRDEDSEIITKRINQ